MIVTARTDSMAQMYTAATDRVANDKKYVNLRCKSLAFHSK